MSEYTPDRWCVIRIPDPKETVYKVFASWSGSYTGSDSWKLNSGITQAVLVNGAWEFEGSSGSGVECPQSVPQRGHQCGDGGGPPPRLPLAPQCPGSPGP